MTALDLALELLALVLTVLPLIALPLVLWGAMVVLSYGGDWTQLIYRHYP